MNSKIARPDVSCHLPQDKTAATIVEVHSSPFEDTIFKCILLGADLLCVHRMYDVAEWHIIFLFPKLPTQQCTHHQSVVQLNITWELFQLHYTLDSVSKEKVPDRLHAALGATRWISIHHEGAYVTFS